MQLDWHFAWRPVAVKCPALLVHLAKGNVNSKRFQRRRFFLIDQSETRIACGGHVC
jgi:hypothetical protein